MGLGRARHTHHTQDTPALCTWEPSPGAGVMVSARWTDFWQGLISPAAWQQSPPFLCLLALLHPHPPFRASASYPRLGWSRGEKGAARRLRSVRAEDGGLLSSGGRRGANEAAGGAAQYLYTGPARARAEPRPSAPGANAPLARGRGKREGAVRREELGPNHCPWQGEGAGVTRPSCEYSPS